MGAKPETEQLVNRNLIGLVAVIFLFYGGLSCLYSTFIPHLISLGFNLHEYKIILTAVALISVIGPLILGPLIDRIADRRKSLYGRYLKWILALLLICGAISYGLLLLVPPVFRPEARQLLVNFGCEVDGAVIYQQRSPEERTCYHWENKKIGKLVLQNCSYTCQDPNKFENLYQHVFEPSAQLVQLESSSREKSDDSDYNDSTEEFSKKDSNLKESLRQMRDVVFSGTKSKTHLIEPPHLCTHKTNDTGHTYIDRCYVYTDDLKSLTINATIHSATNIENKTHSADWCNYPLDDFTCNIPELQYNYLMSSVANCKPVIECQIFEPYKEPSVLAQLQNKGDFQLTYWSYLGIRAFADIFTVSIIVLLNTAIIIATRETSNGRSEIGRQLAWGALGWGIFPLILGYAGIHANLFVPAIICIVLWVIAAIILLINQSIPLDPPEWWWHTKIGMMAIPLSAIRKYTPEIIALSFVAVVLGAFWSIINTYQPSYLLNMESNDGPIVIKLATAMAGIPAIVLLWFAERIVDYCGHANILIAAFATHIIRFLALFGIESPWYALATHSLESITIVLVFVTLVLYMRHLFPRRLIATGQAVAVIATLCIGNAIGIILAPDYEEKWRRYMFRDAAVVAAVIGTLYFLLYHCYLSKKCAPAQQPPPSAAELQTHDGVEHSNGEPSSLNGSNYAPLRIYHNSRGRKGQFRY